VEEGHTTPDAAASSEKEERHLLRQGHRSPPLPPEDPSLTLLSPQPGSQPGAGFEHTLRIAASAPKSPNRRYIMASGWINSLSYLFYEIQLSGKNKYTAMGYPHQPTSFPCNKCFPFKLGSYLLKASHL